jgi:hypothetical protein
VVLQAGGVVVHRDHAVLVVHRARAVQPGLVHLLRVVQPPGVEALGVAAGVARGRRGVEGRQAQALGPAQHVIADQAQPAAHRGGLAGGFQPALGGGAVHGVGELVQRAGQHLHQGHLHIGRGPAAALGVARGQLLQHEQAKAVVVALVPVEVVAQRGQQVRQVHLALAAIRAAAQAVLHDGGSWAMSVPHGRSEGTERPQRTQ